MNRIKFNKNKKTKYQAYKNDRTVKRSKAFCPECNYLRRKLKLDINFTHNPVDCPRSRAAINLLLAEESATVDTEEEDEDVTGKIDVSSYNNSNMSIYQTSRNNLCGEKPIVEIEDQNRVLSLSNMKTNYDTIYKKILSLRDYNNTVRKEQSPQLRTLIGNIIADSIEGSELNCICSTIAAKCKIRFNPVKINAIAAGSHVMKLMGVIPSDVILRVQDSKAEILLVLINAVVVKNFGPNVLIGEPGKLDNNIVTFPKQKLIQIADIQGNYVHLPYHSHRGEPLLPYQPHTVKQNVVLYPQEVPIEHPSSSFYAV